MKTEIVNFINDLPAEVHSYNLSLEEGLYIFVDLHENGNLIGLEKEVYQKSKKEGEINKFLKNCLDIQTNIKPVSPQKIFNPNKKIFNASCSPFAICFKKKILEKNIIIGTNIIKEIGQYFNAASKYTTNEIHIKRLEKFRKFCLENLLNILTTLEEYKNLKSDFGINVFLKSVELSDYHTVYEKYLVNNVFNKEEYSKEIGRIVYGIADSLSSFNDKKMFLKHKTAPFEFNYRLTREDAKSIWQFFQLRNRVLPNPLPIFIDKRELNGKVIAILKEDSKIRFSEIIKNLFNNQENNKDLGNYYLLFFQRGELVDFDFVPVFKYELKDMSIVEIFPLGGKMETKVKNIFGFERDIANRIFNNQLITETKAGGIWLKYFGDLEYNPQYITDNTFNQLLKYRKAFYDYIYKSRRESIQDFMFHDIMIKGILDDIRVDEYKDRKHSREYSIKEKLNIWFSLFNYFNNNSKSNTDMVNKTETLLKRIKQIVESDNESLQTDEEFAFASGQLIRYLLGQSEAGDRTHALLEPFLQKIEPNMYKLAIARTFDMYKHAIVFYKGNTRYSFDIIMSQVMGFKPDTTNMKLLLPLILAGYFSETIFKKPE